MQTDIAWKAAAGLALTDEAFRPTVLTLWRNKLRVSDAPQRIFDAVRAVIVEWGVIANEHRRAIDSTVLDDAVARQDTSKMLVTQDPPVRKLVPELGSVWVREHNFDGGRPPCDWDDPRDRDRLVSELVDDANELVWAAEDLVADGLELNEAQADAVALLALVAGQDVEPAGGLGRWRIARRTAHDRVISTVDPEARHAHKTRRAYRDGYKAHVAAEPDTGLVTACDIGPGNAGDAEAAPDLIADEPMCTEVLGDSAYGSGEFRDHLETRGMTATIKPPPLRPAVEGGYTLETPPSASTPGPSPAPKTSPSRSPGPVRHASAPTARAARSGRAAPPPARGRTIKLHPHHGLLAASRVLADTNAFDERYRQHRPMIERTIAWLVKDNHRRLRDRGIKRNQLGWSDRCAAVNLKRLLTLGLTHNGAWTITTTA